MGAHALLSPSSAKRWLNCTPSACLEQKEEDRGSEFAEEGTCAHALCEIKLRELLGDDTTDAQKEFDELKDKWYSKDMENHAEDYASTVWGKYQEALKKCPDARMFVEKRLSFVDWIPESFGTADAIILADDVIDVIDFKYGRGVEVSAVENPQMAIYALGALAEYDIDYDFKTVRMTIIQPRLYNYSEWETSAKELKDWAEKILKVQAKLAFKGKGKQIAGEWCKFCKVKAKCAVLANDAIAAYTQHDTKELISDNDMGQVLSLIPAIKTWCSAVEEYALGQALSGKKWPGYKVVEGRTSRKVVDPDTLVERIVEAGHEESELYKPKELRALGELERLVGKKNFFQISEGCVEKTGGKPTLVPEYDKRPEMNVNSAEEDFKNIIV